MNELTIRVTSGEDQEENELRTDRILDVLREAEEEGILYFTFEVIRNTYPR